MMTDFLRQGIPMQGPGGSGWNSWEQPSLREPAYSDRTLRRSLEKFFYRMLDKLDNSEGSSGIDFSDLARSAGMQENSQNKSSLPQFFSRMVDQLDDSEGTSGIEFSDL